MSSQVLRMTFIQIVAYYTTECKNNVKIWRPIVVKIKYKMRHLFIYNDRLKTNLMFSPKILVSVEEI